MYSYEEAFFSLENQGKKLTSLARLIKMNDMPGMWYEIKQKQQKMPKARENIYVYTSAQFSGLSFEDEKTLPGMRYEINHMMFFIDLTWRDMYTYQERPGMWYEINHMMFLYEIKQKQQKMPKARAHINVYSNTRFSFFIFEDEMICIPRTAGYVVRNQA